MSTVILQARMGSYRLPGKVLKRVAGKPMLEHQIIRMRRARTIDGIVIATTSEPRDDAIVRLARRLSVPIFRGSENDVLDRYYGAAKEFGARDIVRITGDCPLMDPLVIDWVVEFYLSHKAEFDYISNNRPPTVPDGMDVEVFSLAVLERAWREAKLPSEREHVTPYIWKHKEIFRVKNINWEGEPFIARLVVDRPEDLRLVRKIFAEFYPQNPFFGLREIVAFLREKPELLKINADIARNEGLEGSFEKDARAQGVSVIEGERIYLRPLTVADVTEEKYVRWLNDPEVNRFLENRFIPQTFESAWEYVARASGNPNIYFFAILLKENKKHIGNIKLGPIDWNHRRAEIGIMIGDKSSWGKGYATDVIRLITDFAFQTLGLQKVTAGAYENNLGSIKAFLKAGFFEEGRRVRHMRYEDSYVALVLLARLNEEVGVHA